ncbi:MAG: hypothetical protein AAF368_04155, partial [Planctomycetota bacterium]
YIDHEIHPLQPEMVYQSNGEVWVGALDLDTGLFVSPTGKDEFVDQASSLSLSKNGPEYGLDSGGVSIFYNKASANGVELIWRATRQLSGTYSTQALTPANMSRVNQLVSQDLDSPTTWGLYARQDPAAFPGVIAWLDETAPGMENDVTRVRPGFAGFRWVIGSSRLTSTESEGRGEGQILLGDASTGQIATVTNDPGIKFDPFGWYAPEFGGALAILAIQGSDIVVYRDTGNESFKLHSRLPIPSSSGMSYLQSPEPFVAGGRSYVSLTLKDAPGSIYTAVNEAQIWIYGIEDGAERFALRCDDGEPGRIRHEAETLRGTNEIFLYYNELRPNGRFDIVRCRTGLLP